MPGRRSESPPPCPAGRSTSPISVIDSEEVFEARIAWPGRHLVELGEHGLLDLDPLGHGLDHEVDVAERLVVGGAGDQAEPALELLGVELARVDAAPATASAPSRAPARRTARSTSLSTTGMSALAITCAISPPIVPAPTTAALKTNMLGGGESRERQSGRGRMARCFPKTSSRDPGISSQGRRAPG